MKTEATTQKIENKNKITTKEVLLFPFITLVISFVLGSMVPDQHKFFQNLLFFSINLIVVRVAFEPMSWWLKIYLLAAVAIPLYVGVGGMIKYH